jgi:hypothetical protein
MAKLLQSGVSAICRDLTNDRWVLGALPWGEPTCAEEQVRRSQDEILHRAKHGKRLVTDFLPDGDGVRGYLPSPRMIGQQA